MSKGIDAAMERAARISDSTHQGHVLEEPESKFEAGIQDIFGFLYSMESQVLRIQLALSIMSDEIKDTKAQLTALAKEEGR